MLKLKFTAKIIVCCKICILLQDTMKYILSFLELSKCFEWIIEQLLILAFALFEEQEILKNLQAADSLSSSPPPFS